MIHVTDFKGNIVDFISKNDGAVIEAEHMLNVADKLETFDFEILTSRTEHMQTRNRIVIEDKDGQYREFIIYNISSDLNGYTKVQTNASALEDIKTAKPVPPHKLEKHTVKQALEYALADTGWEVADDSEWGGTRTTSWTGWHDRISILKQLETTYDMRLSFYVEVGTNRIEKRYVRLSKFEALFKGEEIVYGDNMLDLKRTVDFSDIATALMCLGPEDSETGKREIVEIKDDDAQVQFGLPYRYIWDIYEPESSDESMTRARLTTLGRTALNKRKQASITYEISATDLNASVGDLIRVKNEDFTPELYVDAEVTEISTDLISGTSDYKFGVIKEYRRDDIYSRFNAMLGELRERLNNVVSNTGNIISERLEEELKYVERYIEKSPIPPLDPKDGQLWLDTSHGTVPVLKRYENGQWIKSSVTDVKEIGGMTREETIFETLKERKSRIDVDYSGAFNQYDTLTKDRYYHYVESDYRLDLENKFGVMKLAYDVFIGAFNNINSEQPTIGLLTTAISRAIDFEIALRNFRISYSVARKDFDAYMRILQSQYTEEKFKEAMEKVADSIGGTFDGENIIADIPNQEDLKQLNKDIKDYLTGQIDTLDDKLGKKVASDIKTARDELSASISSVEKKMEGLSYENRNLLRNSDICVDGEFYRLSDTSYIELEAGQQYTLSLDIDIVNARPDRENYIGFEIRVEFTDGSSSYYNAFYYLQEGSHTVKKRISNTFALPNKEILEVSRVNLRPQLIEADKALVCRPKLEKGSVATDWTPAPEDLENKISDITQTVTKHDNSINVLEREISLKANSTEVTQQLNHALEPIRNDVKKNEAELKVQADLINQKVNNTQYTADMNGVVSDLRTAQSDIVQLSDEVSSKVDVTEYERLNAENEEVFTNFETELRQTKEIVNSKVGYEQLNANNKTIERLFTEFVQTDNSFRFEVDTNGVIQNVIFDKDSFAINNRLINFHDGDVIIKDGVTTIKDAYIYKLISEDAFIQNAEVTKLVSRDYRDVFNLEAGLMRWQRADGRNMTFSLDDGIKYFNQDGTLRFQANQNLVISSAFGTSNSNVYLGSRSNAEIRAVTYADIPGDGSVYSYRYRPVRALEFFGNRLSVNHGTSSINLYLSPLAGGEVRVTHNTTTDIFRPIRSSRVYADALNVNEASNLYLGVTSSYEVRVVAKDTIDSYMSLRAHGLYGNFIRQNGGDNLYIGTANEMRIVSPNSETTYKNVRGGWALFNALDVNTGTHLYIRPVSGGEVRVTTKGTTNAYMNIRANKFIESSHYKYKYDIELWEGKALNVIKQIDLYTYKMKFDTHNMINYGMVIGGDYKTTPKEFINGDGIDRYNVSTFTLRAIQELAHENDELKSEIKELKPQINKIMEMIA